MRPNTIDALHEYKLHALLKSYIKECGRIPKSKNTHKIVYTSLKLLDINLSKFPNVVHIVGSTAKGTTLLILAQILERLGLNIGFITKPHTYSIRERVYAAGRYLNYDYINNFFKTFLPKLNRMLQQHKYPCLSYLEAMFILSIKYLYEFHENKNLDVIIIEAGRGFIYDYTNIFQYKKPKYYNVILTKITKNHTKALGNTLLEIFKSKTLPNIQDNIFWLFPNSIIIKSKFFQGLRNIYYTNFQGKIKDAIKTSLTGSLLPFKQHNIATNLISSAHLETLYKLIVLITKYKRKLGFTKLFNLTENKLLLQLNPFYINLPARMQFIGINDNYLLIDNAHTKDQYYTLINTLKNTEPSIIKLDKKLSFYFLFNEEFQLEQSRPLISKIKRKIAPLSNIQIFFKPKSNNNIALREKSVTVITGSIFQIRKWFFTKLHKYGEHSYSKRVLKQLFMFNNHQIINNAILTQRQIARLIIKKQNRTFSKDKALQERINKRLIDFLKRFIKLNQHEVVVTFNPILKYEANIASTNSFIKDTFKYVIIPTKINGKWYLQNQKTKQVFPNFSRIYKHYGPLIALIPGLVFDKFNNRLGYGLGTYDKWLMSLKYTIINPFTNLYTVKTGPLEGSTNARKYTKTYLSKLAKTNILIPVYYPKNSVTYIAPFCNVSTLL